jgi:hypothetical protein
MTPMTATVGAMTVGTTSVVFSTTFDGDTSGDISEVTDNDTTGSVDPVSAGIGSSHMVSET